MIRGGAYGGMLECGREAWQEEEGYERLECGRCALGFVDDMSRMAIKHEFLSNIRCLGPTKACYGRHTYLPGCQICSIRLATRDCFAATCTISLCVMAYSMTRLYRCTMYRARETVSSRTYTADTIHGNTLTYTRTVAVCQTQYAYSPVTLPIIYRPHK